MIAASPTSSISGAALKELPRSERRKLKKKAKRKHLNSLEQESQLDDGELQSLEDDFLEKQAAAERELHNRLWLEREEAARKEMQAQKEKEAREAEEKLRAAERKKAEAEERKRKREEDKKKQEDEKNRFTRLTSMSAAELAQIDKEYAKSYGTEKDQVHCSFYLKTGSCRFGASCGKGHPYPQVSNTIMFKNMYIGPGMSEIHEEDAGDDMQHEESEKQTHFREFFEDVLPEFERFGPLLNFKVCRNNALHLRGNVYVQYRELSDAVKAFTAFNSRFYAGKQLTPEFVPVTKWKPAICGLSDRNLCPKGKQCNFLHVFRNPGGRFADADRDFLPLPSNKRKDRDDDNDRDRHSRQHREQDRDRDREHDDADRERKRDKERERSRERERDRDKDRERDRERERSRDQDRDRDRDRHRERDRDKDRHRK